MIDKVIVKEALIEEIVKITETIVEFDAPFQKEHYENKYGNKEKLIIAAYINDNPIGFIVSYDKFCDGSLYCWMVGVNPNFRGMGVFKLLMNYLNNWAKEKGYNKIKITTRNDKREMLSYLVKYGFLFTQVKTYPDIVDNRICLEKEI